MLLKLLISMIAAVTSSALIKDAPPTSHPPPPKLPAMKASAPSKPSNPPAPKLAKKKTQVIKVFEASDNHNKTTQQWRKNGRLVKRGARPSGVILKSKEFLFAKKDTILKSPL